MSYGGREIARQFLPHICSMLVLNPQSGDSSGTSLEVPSEALLQVAKRAGGALKKKITKIIKNLFYLTTTQTTCAAINSLPRSKVENMIVTFKKPVEGVRGKIRLEYGFYVRKMYGKYILQRCPNRKGHVPTEKEKANQQRFIQQYRRAPRTVLSALPK